MRGKRPATASFLGASCRRPKGGALCLPNIPSNTPFSHPTDRSAELPKPASLPTVRRPSPARLPPRAAAVAGLLLAGLAGCSPDINSFAPVCPESGILADAADLTRYAGNGRDVTDLVLDGRITGLAGTCKRGDRRNLLDTSLIVQIEATRGPAAATRTADFTWFVSVTKGDQILDKQDYRQSVTFPENVDRVRVTSDEIPLIFPVPPGTSGAAYHIYVGFQLTPDELALNRQRGPR
jgi:hypothetical protein